MSTAPGPGPSDPADDPFFGPVRRRHPDVDIVLLPPEQSPEQDPDERQGAEPDEPVDRARLDAVGDQLRRELSTLGVTEAPVETVRWRYADVDGAVVGEVTGLLDEPVADRDRGLLERLDRGLREAGWTVLVPDSGVPRVEASRASGVARSVLAARPQPAATVSVTVTSGPLQVGRERSRDLVRSRSS